MSSYHLSAKVIGRSAGRSATGAAAYRAAEKILDERTDVVYDFTRKRGVEYSELLMPEHGVAQRAVFWNQVELHHRRGDAVLAREVEVALPAELSPGQRQTLALVFARELVDRYGVAADVAIHAPSREGDERNHHAHIMLSACRVAADGTLGKKAVELDPIYCQKHQLPNMADRERVRWAELTNDALERAGHVERVDHRSLKDQGIERIPTSHLGPAVAGMVRRGVPSKVNERIAAEVQERLVQAHRLGELERDGAKLDREIIDTSGDLANALRDRQAKADVQAEIESGVNTFRARFSEHHKGDIGQVEGAQAFAVFKAEYEAKEQAKLAAREARAQNLARQRARPSDKDQHVLTLPTRQRGLER